MFTKKDWTIGFLFLITVFLFGVLVIQVNKSHKETLQTMQAQLETLQGIPVGNKLILEAVIFDGLFYLGHQLYEFEIVDRNCTATNGDEICMVTLKDNSGSTITVDQRILIEREVAVYPF